MFGTLGVVGSSGGSGDGASRARQPVGNGNLTPYNFTTTSNRFINYRKRRRVATNANYAYPRLRYDNWTDNGVAEVTTYPDMVIRTGILYGGVFYSAKFNGATDVVLPSGNSVTSDAAAVTMNAGDFFTECVRVTLPLLFDNQVGNFVLGETVTGGTSGATGVISRQTDAGATGSLTLLSETGTFVDNETLTGGTSLATALVNIAAQNQIYTISSKKQWREGLRSGQISTVDWTGSENGVTWPNFTPVFTAGNITGATRDGNGTGQAAGPNLAAWFMDAQGRLQTKVIGYCFVAGNVITGVSITSGTPPAGTTWDQATTQVVAYGGSGFGLDTAIFCASLVDGIPSVNVKSATLCGDSWGRGDSSTDTTGDQYGNFGLYERALANRCGLVNMSVSSGLLANFANASIYPKLFEVAPGHTSHTIIQQVTNDIAPPSSRTKAQIEGNINTLRTIFRDKGSKFTYCTCAPRTTGSWASEGTQTPESGFAAAGVMDQFNASALAGVNVPTDVPVIDVYSFVRGVDPNKIRVDLGTISDDGIHLNLLGLALTCNNASFKATLNFLN